MKTILLILSIFLFAVSNSFADETQCEKCINKITITFENGKYIYSDGETKIQGINPQDKLKHLDGLVTDDHKTLVLNAAILDPQYPQASMISIYNIVNGVAHHIKNISFGHGVRAINFSKSGKKLYVIENFLYEISLTNFETKLLELDDPLTKKVSKEYFNDDGTEAKCLKE